MTTLAYRKSLAKAQVMAEKVSKLLEENNEYFETYPYIDLIDDDIPQIAVEVDWGEWKHSHMWLDWVIRENLGYKKSKEEVTEEDGSDTYSSIHYYTMEG